MSEKKYAVIFGVLFLLIGIVGFIPLFTPDGLLLKLFTASAPHNVVHIFTGIVALLASMSAYWSRMFFKIFGIIYLFLAALAVLFAGDLVFMHLNMADNIFHLLWVQSLFIWDLVKPKTHIPRRVTDYKIPSVIILSTFLSSHPIMSLL